MFFLQHIYMYNKIGPKIYFHKYFDIFIDVCGMHSYVHVVEKSALVVTADVSYARITYIFRVELHYKSNIQFIHKSSKSFIFPVFLSLFLPVF